MSNVFEIDSFLIFLFSISLSIPERLIFCEAPVSDDSLIMQYLQQ